MRYFIPWTPEEDANLAGLRNRGFTGRQAAEVLNRSVSAVYCRINKAGIWRDPLACKPTIVSISREEVPAWYELGWRFIGFNHGLCEMEWRSKKSERRPTAVALLEAA